MHAIIDAALNRWRTILSILALLLVSGASAYVSIPKESNPDIAIPIIYVSLSLSGISPEDAERLLVRPVEQELRTISGVRKMTSSAYVGGGNVVLEFDAGFNSERALRDVRNAVDDIRSSLPSEADEPSVNEVNLSLFPVLVVTISGDVPERTRMALASQLQEALEALPSVLEANLAGHRDEEVEVVIDPVLIDSYGLNGNDVLSMFSRSNRLVAAGSLDTGAGEFSVTLPGLFRNVDDILNMPLRVDGDAVVRFRDIATVRRTFEDRRSYARLNGEPATALEIVKRSGDNVIDTIDAVRNVVASVSADWPEGVSVTFSQDESVHIRTMLLDLQNNVISAVLLVMVVIVGALGLRSAGLVGLAIPGSFLTGILVLFTMGLTINMVVLFSLILAVGMLVDGAIVVVEYADRKMAEGLHRREAYRMAAHRMAWPITASTATTLAAFLPLLFWPGIPGQFMMFLPITLLATLSASLLMALVFVPTVGSLIGKAGAADPERMKALAASETGDLRDVGGLTGGYVRMLDRALGHPGKVILAGVALLIGVWWYFGTHGTGVLFFPDIEPEQLIVQVHARGNLSIEESDALVAEVESRVLGLRQDFKSVYTTVGRTGNTQAAPDVIGSIYVELAEWDERRPAAEIIAALEAFGEELPGIYIEVREPDQGPSQGKPVNIEVTSRDPVALATATERLRAHMDSMPGLRDVEDNRPIPAIEWELTVDRAQAAKFGLDITAVGDTVRLVTNGLRVGEYRPDDTREEIDIIIRYPREYRTIEQLDHLRIVTSEGPIPISSFVTRAARPEQGTISRVGGERAFVVQADVAPGQMPLMLIQELRQWLAQADMPAGVTFNFAGEDEDQAEAQAFLGNAFLVALFLMAIILLTQFNRFYSAFLILSAVIMSTVGVVLGLLITQQPFIIIMTGVGVISLAGIVVNNNIVLIDTFDHLKKRILDPREAILRTGAQRLRPVVLTTVTTVLGLMPMVLQVNIDFLSREVEVGAPSTQWWVSLATAIVFGLTFSTVLTLVFTPCALMVRANLAARRDRMAERRVERRAARQARRAARKVPGPAAPPPGPPLAGQPAE